MTPHRRNNAKENGMKLLSLALAACLLLPAPSLFAAETSVSTYTENSSFMKINVSWQRSGIRVPDGLSDALVKKKVVEFRTTAEQEYLEMVQAGASRFPMEMHLEGTLFSNGRTLCMLWEDYRYLGGAHGGLMLSSQNYSLPDGEPVGFDTLFRKPEEALRLVSALSREKLLARNLPTFMVEPGTAPELENFRTFRLEKDGITFYFEPYQVASWADGVITVTISLKEMAKAAPDLRYWP